MQGWKPADICICVGPAPKRLPPDDEVEQIHPTVWTDGETPEIADLRWCHGVLVHLLADEGIPESVFDRWVTAVVEAGPAKVGMLGPTGEVALWAP